ncbi:MAG: GNAT family N-acetyltransferase [Actinomycetota bacterium]|nr:GNAT family N-acetyltransferase [Actinomycetota bacterium]
MIITPATEDDWEAFGRVRLASLREPGSPQAASLGREEGFREPHWRLRLRGAMYLLAWEDDARQRAVGVAGMMQEPGAPVEERLIVALFVRPSHRRQGIGAALVRAATHWAAVDDAKVVSAWVVDDEEPAIALFEGSGFLPTGERVRMPRNPERYEARWSLTLANDEVVQQRKEL